MTFVVIVADQLSKIFVKGFSIPFLNFKVEGMFYGQRIPIIGDFFQFTFVENPGMAFGIDIGNGLKLYLSLFSVIASIGLLIYIYSVRRHSLSLRLSLALILGGAIGNLIDRVFYGVFYGYAPLFYGKVVDFFDVDFFNFELFGRYYDRWPIFNIADMAVTCGVILLLVFYKKHQEEAEILFPEAESNKSSAIANGIYAENTEEFLIKENDHHHENNNKPHNGEEVQI